MSTDSPPNTTRVTHKRQLISWLETGAKAPSKQLVGVEWEKFLIHRNSFAPAAYGGEQGISVFLDEMIAFGWQPLTENDKIIGLHRGASAISLEPGGQLELASAPHASVHDVAEEMGYHLDEVNSVCRVLGLMPIGIGFQPKAHRDEMDLMPKGRYALMSTYMPKVGSLGLDMMLRAAGIQASYDFSSEADMAAKFRVALALQPLVGALYASSPFRDGHLSGDLSFRNRVWQHTDPDRCGTLEFVFDESFGFESYVDWALSVPMYFIRRGSQYIDARGASFTDFMNGRIKGLEGELPTMSDWNDHLTTVFPQVRLKRTLEMRGADSGGFSMMLALPALWTGLLYDSTSLSDATTLYQDWDAGARLRMYNDGPRLGLETPLAGRTVCDILLDIVDIAEQGLIRRAQENLNGESEAIYLKPLHQILRSGLSQAEEMRRRFLDDWNGDVSKLFKYIELK